MHLNQFVRDSKTKVSSQNAKMRNCICYKKTITWKSEIEWLKSALFVADADGILCCPLDQLLLWCCVCCSCRQCNNQIQFEIIDKQINIHTHTKRNSVEGRERSKPNNRSADVLIHIRCFSGSRFSRIQFRFLRYISVSVVPLFSFSRLHHQLLMLFGCPNIYLCGFFF